MTTRIQKLLEQTADPAALGFGSIGPASYYTATLNDFLRAVVTAAIADGVKLETLMGILMGCTFRAMDEVSPSRVASIADIDTLLKIVQAQHARITTLHDPAHIEELKNFHASRHD
jgi:hypothetical protein